jgi:ATP synthase protein I
MGGKPMFPVVKWVLRMQILAIALIACAVWTVWGWMPAKSALLGGAAAFLPNAYFAAQFGTPDTARTAKDVIKLFYYGETVKLIITAVLLVLIFQLPDIMFAPLFASFGAVLTVFWFALLARGTDL